MYKPDEFLMNTCKLVSHLSSRVIDSPCIFCLLAILFHRLMIVSVVGLFVAQTCNMGSV